VLLHVWLYALKPNQPHQNRFPDVVGRLEQRRGHDEEQDADEEDLLLAGAAPERRLERQHEQRDAAGAAGGANHLVLALVVRQQVLLVLRRHLRRVGREEVAHQRQRAVAEEVGGGAEADQAQRAQTAVGDQRQHQVVHVAAVGPQQTLIEQCKTQCSDVSARFMKRCHFCNITSFIKV